jgi:hypothetical protein
MKEMLTKKLETLEWEYIKNENKDRGYDFDLARKLKAEIAEVEKELAELG